MFELKHSRDAEREADKIGLNMVEIAGFDAFEASKFIDKLHSFIEVV